MKVNVDVDERGFVGGNIVETELPVWLVVNGIKEAKVKPEPHRVKQSAINVLLTEKACSAFAAAAVATIVVLNDSALWHP